MDGAIRLSYNRPQTYYVLQVAILSKLHVAPDHVSEPTKEDKKRCMKNVLRTGNRRVLLSTAVSDQKSMQLVKKDISRITKQLNFMAKTKKIIKTRQYMML